MFNSFVKLPEGRCAIDDQFISNQILSCHGSKLWLSSPEYGGRGFPTDWIWLVQCKTLWSLCSQFPTFVNMFPYTNSEHVFSIPTCSQTSVPNTFVKVLWCVILDSPLCCSLYVWLLLVSVPTITHFRPYLIHQKGNAQRQGLDKLLLWGLICVAPGTQGWSVFDYSSDI